MFGIVVADFEPDALRDNFADHEFRVSVGSSIEHADLSNNCIEHINDLSRHRYVVIMTTAVGHYVNLLLALFVNGSDHII